MSDVRFSGTLEDPADPESALAAARAAFAVASVAEHHRALGTVLAALRTEVVLLDLSMAGAEAGLRLTAVEMDNVDWVPVFSSLDELARWRQCCDRGDETVHYATVPGTELGELIEEDAGIVLDPGSDAPLALPVQRIRGDQQ